MFYPIVFKSDTYTMERWVVHIKDLAVTNINVLVGWYWCESPIIDYWDISWVLVDGSFWLRIISFSGAWNQKKKKRIEWFGVTTPFCSSGLTLAHICTSFLVRLGNTNSQQAKEGVAPRLHRSSSIGDSIILVFEAISSWLSLPTPGQAQVSPLILGQINHTVTEAL